MAVSDARTFFSAFFEGFGPGALFFSAQNPDAPTQVFADELLSVESLPSRSQHGHAFVALSSSIVQLPISAWIVVLVPMASVVACVVAAITDHVMLAAVLFVICLLAQICLVAQISSNRGQKLERDLDEAQKLHARQN